MACLAQWGALVCSCCSEEQPMEVKLMAAKVLVNCTATVLTCAHLPLGESQLWNHLTKYLPHSRDKYFDVNRNAYKSHKSFRNLHFLKLLVCVCVCVCVRSVHHTFSVEESVYAAAGRRPGSPRFSH